MKTLIIYLLLFPVFAFGQVYDNFSDGDLNNNPIWQGDLSSFKINNNFQVQLNQSEAGLSYLSIPIGISDSLEWNFSIRLAFSPSGSNYARVYLMANTPNLAESIKGYYLQFGEALGEDAVELFKREGTEIQSICRGTNGSIASSFNVDVKVTYSTDAQWNIFVDWEQNGNYIPECSGKSQADISEPFFGFFCSYTSSNATKFYFDNVKIDHIYKDVEAPILESIKALSTKELLLKFNEALDPVSAETIDNYQISESEQRPSSAILNLANPSDVTLYFEEDFPANQNLNLEINRIEDLLGNIMQKTSLGFFFSKAKYGDVLIHEIMADPSPTQGLPDAEYLELYNQADYPVSLNNWHLLNGSSDFQFPEQEIPPKGFLILSHPDKVEDLSGYGNVLALPSFRLTNSGKTLVLKNKSEQIIHYVDYRDTWYADDLKREGGWSLEMISTDYFCEQAINWSASKNPQGGSPGSANSLADLEPDYQLPRINSVDLINENTLHINFSKSMDSLSLKNLQNYSADHNLGEPSEIKIQAPAYNQAEITFAKNVEENTIYHLNISPELKGCCGAELENLSERFAKAHEPEFKDIIINEILFDAWLDDGEYVELFNRSNKVIDLRQLLFSRISIDQYDTTYYSVQPIAGQIFPEEYLLLCKNKASVLDVYYSENPEEIYAYDDFPLLPNSEGQVVLSKSSNKFFIIDAFSYSEKMHHPLLNNTRGISLERLSHNGETNDIKNWQSAAASVNYGTPGYQNSQYQEERSPDETIQISPEIFSPDLDGFDDLLQINYQFAESGNTINLHIYNEKGQDIRYLVKNEIAGLNGQIFWDGTTEEGEKAPLGIYILYFEYFNLNGDVKKIKKTCVLGGKL